MSSAHTWADIYLKQYKIISFIVLKLPRIQDAYIAHGFLAEGQVLSFCPF